ncbi:hypothetical protein S7711_05788 [Stachybotrys chartarum IBT 7711]|uniref:Uncharacterized protein n=1 Tax=Stachybotrys chartarum (strain CBS 109288 / IBT 7711) TaxID=1280523 RepID=A0A084ATH9_STACB|nr:hypothetical protein S7711_05788 [Stachybotrys chartarum IBT 7711]
MFRHNSFKRQERRPLGRSKSTNSIPTSNSLHVLQNINPAVAERDAHIAATLSYHRAHRAAPGSTTNVTTRCSVAGLGRSNSSVSRREMAEPNGVTGREDGGGSSNLRRQQSVRFAGPSAQSKRPLAARAIENRSRRSDHASTSRNSGHDVLPAPKLARHILYPESDCYTLEDDIVSIQSSYRKLRKSKSMFTSSGVSQADFSFGNHGLGKSKRTQDDASLASSRVENVPPKKPATPHLRAPKSMSFLQHRGQREASRVSSRAENDLAVQLARERFRDQVEQQSKLKTYPSMFFRSRSKGTESALGFRKSMRNSSNSSAPMPSAFAGDVIVIPKHGGLRGTVRKVSKTLKSKMKGLFSRPRSSNETRPDGWGATTSESEAECALDEASFAVPEEASLSRVQSHVPSLHAIASSQQMRSRQGSLECGERDDEPVQDDKSRVTSWTDSTTNTVKSVGFTGDWERQRLSIIKENGTHVSTTSLSKPLHGQALPSSGTTAESQRVYAALMEKLEDMKQRDDRLRKKSVEDFRIHGIAPPRSSSVDHAESQGWSPATIRCVPTNDDVFQDKAMETTRDSASPDSLTKGQQLLAPYRQAPQGIIPPGPYPYTTRRQETSHESSSDKTTNNLAPSEHRTAYASRSSAFFASPPSHLFRTASPYRRALRENMKAAQVGTVGQVSETNYLKSLSELSLPIRQPSSIGSERLIRSDDAASVYSINLEDDKMCQAKHEPTWMDPGDPSQGQRHGDATIFVSEPKCRTAQLHQRDFSAASSVEWKTWLSANVSKLEASTLPAGPTHRAATPYSLPLLGHVREDAEIESVQVTPKVERTTSAGKSKNPWSGEQILFTPVTKQAQHTTNTNSTALDENSAPAASETTGATAPGLTPSIPPRVASKLRNAASLPSVKATIVKETEPDADLPRMRSSNTVGKPSPISREERMRRRRGRIGMGKGLQSPATSSPGLTLAVEKQFRKVASGTPACSPSWIGKRSIASLRSEAYAADDLSSHAANEAEIQNMGSRTMVDMFLNSRRRKMAQSGSGSVSEESPSVFL